MKKLLVYIGLIPLLSSCFFDYEPSGYVVPDVVQPNLPEYTNVGNNTYGVLVNENKAWAEFYSNNNPNSAEQRMTDKGSSIEFILIDDVKSHTVNDLGYFLDTLYVELNIVGGIDEPEDLIGVYPITTGKSKVRLKYHRTGMNNTITGGKGRFEIIDAFERDGNMVVAGTFGFTLDGGADLEELSFFKGRFDYYSNIP